MNNNDMLKKELSLEDMHQWAKKSADLTTQLSDDYFVYTVNSADSCVKNILFTGTAVSFDIKVEKFADPEDVEIKKEIDVEKP
jgi:hypothetical protein